VKDTMSNQTDTFQASYPDPPWYWDLVKRITGDTPRKEEFDALEKVVHAIADASPDAAARAAAESAEKAATSAASIEGAEGRAAASAADALSSADAASASAANAAMAKANADESAANAASSEMNASASASSAKTSETNASASASSAKTSETNASASASSAKTSETNASASASGAAASAAFAAKCARFYLLEDLASNAFDAQDAHLYSLTLTAEQAAEGLSVTLPPAASPEYAVDFIVRLDATNGKTWIRELAPGDELAEGETLEVDWPRGNLQEADAIDADVFYVSFTQTGRLRWSVGYYRANV
jgi:chemotaxis protein histidine kinase CheA